MITITIVTLLFIILIIFCKQFLRKIYLGSKIPGPLALPLIGNGLDLLNKKPSEMFHFVVSAIKQSGNKITRFWIGPHLLIYLTDPKLVEALLNSTTLIEKSIEYDTMRPWLNDGLLMSTGRKWHQRRKIITPTFHFKILEQFVDIFNQQGDILINKLSKYTSNDKVELFPIIALHALDIICETSMGTKINAQIQSDSEYVKAIHTIAHVLHLRMFNPLLGSNIIFKLSKYAKQQDDSLKVLHGFTDQVIQKRRQELLNAHNQTDHADDAIASDLGVKRKLAFLDMLLQSTINGQTLNDLDIREEVDTFMFEGHDTTTSGLTFTLYNIAKYPDIQERCYQEIKEIIGNDSNSSLSLSQLNSLNYMEKVIKESFRLYPPVPLFARHIRQEFKLTDDITIPAGCTLGIVVYAMGRDSKLFPNPEQFDPNRFDQKHESPFTYVPFSAGLRNCIGQKFALLEMKSAITKLLLNYKLTLNADSQNEPTLMAELVLKPESEINFHLEKRN